MLFKSKRIEKRKENRKQPKKLIQKAKNNLRQVKFVKWDFWSEQVESRSIVDGSFKNVYDFYRLHKLREDADRRERSDRYKYVRQRKTLRELLDLGDVIYVLSERFKKKMPPVDLVKARQKRNLSLIGIKYLRDQSI